MSRLDSIFNIKSNVLNVYCTAGYPKLNDTVPIMQALQNSGVDIIELGMPYSDPLADGPVIQESSTIALQNGMSITVLFDQLKNFRNLIHIPVVLMGYLNPILQYGFEKFCKQASEVGIDGIIIPDLPEIDFISHYQKFLQDYKLQFIFLVTPKTSIERIKMLDKLSSGFLYAVSSSSTTGSAKNWNTVNDFLKKLQSLYLKNPVLVGFGIFDKASYNAVINNADGVIIGSAFILVLKNSKSSIQDTVHQFITQIVS